MKRTFSACVIVLFFVVLFFNVYTPKAVFASWLKNVTAEDIDFAAVYNNSGEAQTMHELSTEDVVQLVDLLHALKSDTVKHTKEKPTASDYYLFCRIGEQEFMFRCVETAMIQMVFDRETATQMEPNGKSCWIDSTELYNFIIDYIDLMKQLDADQGNEIWIVQSEGDAQVLVNTLTGKKILEAVRTTENGFEQLDLIEYARILNQSDALK